MQIERSNLCEEKLLMVESDRTMRSKGAVKKKFYLPHLELLDGVGDEAEQFNLPRPNLATEDTYSNGGEDDVRGRREDGVREVAAAKRFVAGVVEG